MREARRIVVAVTGGIAAYKIPELVRLLRGAGHEVRCVLTPEARHFVSPLVLQTLTAQSVRSELLDPGEEGEIGHIELADWADLVLVAPATANVLAKMCHGLADDLVTAVLLATRAPVYVAPAMNVQMWEHPATRSNVQVLLERGVRTIGPDSGELACGWVGEGRMAAPEAIVWACELALGPRSLEGEHVLVTAGGTCERIDAVRHIANRSSGRMGFAIAAEAVRRGARVTLVAGDTALATPEGLRRVDAPSALAMREAVLADLRDATIVVKAAAVADFRPVSAETGKIKKEDLADGEGLTLELVRTPDILAEICAMDRETPRGRRVIVGFAAESHDVVESARRKMERKGCDLLVANDISRADAGFDVETNAVFFVWPSGDVEELPLQSKEDVAGQLLDRVEKLRRGS